MDLFAAAEARHAGDQALALHEENQPDWLAMARRIALSIYRETGQPVNVNQVRDRVGPPPKESSPTIMGAVFNRKDWEAVGDLNSDRKTCHARRVRLFVPRAA